MLPQGYVDAARVFERESGTAPGVDLDQITDRMNIRKAVQSGDVEQVTAGGGGGGGACQCPQRPRCGMAPRHMSAGASA